MALTKNDMCRVIIQALYSLPALPSADCRTVVYMAKGGKPHLTHQHALAVRIIQDGVADGTWPEE